MADLYNKFNIVNKELQGTKIKSIMAFVGNLCFQKQDIGRKHLVRFSCMSTEGMVYEESD